MPIPNRHRPGQPRPPQASPLTPEPPVPPAEPAAVGIEPVVEGVPDAVPVPAKQPDTEDVMAALHQLRQKVLAIPPAATPKPATAIESLISQLLNKERSAEQTFHLVILPPDENMSVEHFTDVNELVIRIRGFIDTPTRVAAFLGSHLKVSKGPNRFLVTPYGPLPLFELPDQNNLELDDDGYLGAPEIKFEVPKFENEQAALFAAQDAEDAAAAEEEDDTPVLPAQEAEPAVPPGS